MNAETDKSAKILHLSEVETDPGFDPSVDETIDKAANADFEQVMVIGVKDGNIYQYSSDMSVHKVIYLLEMVKHHVLDAT